VPADFPARRRWPGACLPWLPGLPATAGANRAGPDVVVAAAQELRHRVRAGAPLPGMH